MTSPPPLPTCSLDLALLSMGAWDLRNLRLQVSAMMPLQLVRSFLRDDTLSDEVLDLIRDGAIGLVEHFIGYSIAPGTYTESHNDHVVYLAHAPVSSVEYVRAGGVDVSYRLHASLGIIVLEEAQEVEVRYAGGMEKLPEDLSFAILGICQALYQRMGSFGAKSESVQGYDIEYADDIPPHIRGILEKYWRPPKC